MSVATAALLGWSVWPTISPAREVTVSQAVFDRSSQTTEPDHRGRASPLRPMVQAAGWLEAEPFSIACTALADGVIESIHVLEGDSVEQGQLVAQLVADDATLRLRRADAQLARAQAEVRLAIAEAEAAQRAWDEPVELERAFAVASAALDENRAELAQLPHLVRAGEAELVRLKEESARVQRSTAQGATNELEAIVARQRVAAHQEQVEALRARRAILEARSERLSAEVRAAERELDLRIEDRRRLDAARATLAAAESAAAHAAAVRDEAALELERMTIRAPISGFVKNRLRQPGDKVVRMMDSPHSAHIVHLYDPDRLQVRVDVPLADASHIAVGQRCEVVVEVLPDRTFAGEVLRITHEADLQKNTLQAKVRVLDPDPVLRPEMLTRVRFLPGEQQSGESSASEDHGTTRVLVPERALDEANGSAQLWVVTDRKQGRGVLAARSVAIISRADGWARIEGSVPPGSLIAVGVQDAREGERVSFLEQREENPS
ncbi:MAG: efflux RND transporter periplasmic adaptor subunit [Phycisphaerales bacterium]